MNKFSKAFFKANGRIGGLSGSKQAKKIAGRRGAEVRWNLKPSEKLTANSAESDKPLANIDDSASRKPTRQKGAV